MINYNFCVGLSNYENASTSIQTSFVKLYRPFMGGIKNSEKPTKMENLTFCLVLFFAQNN